MAARHFLDPVRIVHVAPLGLQDLDGFLFLDDGAVEAGEILAKRLHLIAGVEQGSARQARQA